MDMSSHSTLSHMHGAIQISTARQRELIDQLRQFELGRFLIENRGLNGRWTDYVLQFPDRGARSGMSSDGTPLTQLERWILSSCPIFLATQERFRIFKRIIQRHVQSSSRLASIPSGVMSDLLQLSYEGTSGVILNAIDIDESSLELVRQNKHPANVDVRTTLADAWNLTHGESLCFDVITSNGLNIYVADDTQCTALYTSFAQALRPGGILVTSFITPLSTWEPKRNEDLSFQRELFVDAVGITWQCVRSEELTRKQLATAGLGVEEILYDQQRMFPTVVARKIF